MAFARYAEMLIKKLPEAKNHYMAVQNIKRALPILEDEVPIPTYIKKMHRSPFLWIGNFTSDSSSIYIFFEAPANHYEFCHFDPDDNIFTLISGKKHFRLYNPSQLHNLYPNPLGSKGYTIQSQVRISSFFKCEYCSKLKCVGKHLFAKSRKPSSI
jgi:hypothetical protein